MNKHVQGGQRFVNRLILFTPLLFRVHPRGSLGGKLFWPRGLDAEVFLSFARVIKSFPPRCEMTRVNRPERSRRSKVADYRCARIVVSPLSDRKRLRFIAIQQRSVRDRATRVLILDSPRFRLAPHRAA